MPFVNAELKRASAAGAPYVQFDEPAFWTMPGGHAEMVEIFNACVERVDATIGIHLCFGNLRRRPATSDRRMSASCGASSAATRSSLRA